VKQSLKHEVSRTNVPQEFPQIDLNFWFVLFQDKMNRIN